MRLNLDAAYQEGLSVIAVAAFRKAFKETLQYAARISPAVAAWPSCAENASDGNTSTRLLPVSET